MPAPVRDLVTHIWRRLDRSGRCWLWTGARSAGGYGQIRIANRLHWMHRLMYEWAFGPVPDGLIVMHACDTPACCNPAHLHAGTFKDNSRDMARKGRQWKQRAHLRIA